MYIHCTRGHGRTGIVCALLLAITYHISGPHAILLYQALHDVAAKAFRRELRAADVTVEFVSRDGTISSKTISHEGARSFRKVAALAATLGVEPSDGFLATHVSGECVRVHDEQSLGLVLDGLINVERQESAQPRLRLTATPKTALKERATYDPLQPPRAPSSQTAASATDARKQHFAAVSAAAAMVGHGLPARSLATTLASCAQPTGTTPSVEVLATALAKIESDATRGMNVDEGERLLRSTGRLLRLQAPGCDYCHALCPDQTRQVLRLLQVTTLHSLKAANKSRILMAERANLAKEQLRKDQEADQEAKLAEAKKAKALQDSPRKRKKKRLGGAPVTG
jgi:hypothetical protein